MTPPLMGGEEDGHSTVAVSSSPTDCLSQNGIGLKERNYLGFSDCSSVDSSGVSSQTSESKSDLNFRATELRLGLPGSQSPEREVAGEKNLFPLLPSSSSMKSVVSGNKRGFSEVKASAAQPVVAVKETAGKAAPSAKAQVVGWPPIRSFRKNSLSMASKNNEEVDGKLSSGALFIKVSMDGAPYLRKVDLRSYATYQELSSALEKMFSCFTIGQCGSHGAPSKEKLSESKLRDLLNGSEYVLTYEDKDGDWMLVGDVPWEMFIDSCKKLKIMKGSDAIGLAPKQK